MNSGIILLTILTIENSIYQRGMEDAPENSKELLHSAHANAMNE
jgi:hypothetical protein